MQGITGKKTLFYKSFNKFLRKNIYIIEADRCDDPVVCVGTGWQFKSLVKIKQLRAIAIDLCRSIC